VELGYYLCVFPDGYNYLCRVYTIECWMIFYVESGTHSNKDYTLVFHDGILCNPIVSQLKLKFLFTHISSSAILVGAWRLTISQIVPCTSCSFCFWTGARKNSDKILDRINEEHVEHTSSEAPELRILFAIKVSLKLVSDVSPTSACLCIFQSEKSQNTKRHPKCAQLA